MVSERVTVPSAGTYSAKCRDIRCQCGLVLAIRCLMFLVQSTSLACMHAGLQTSDERWDHSHSMALEKLVWLNLVAELLADFAMEAQREKGGSAETYLHHIVYS